MELGLKDKVILATGGSRGIGFAIAKTLCEAGCKICLVSRGEESLCQAKTELLKTNRSLDIFTISGDVSDPNLADQVVNSCIGRFGAVHVLINNAGGPPPGSFLEHNTESWYAAIESNLMSVVRFSTLVAPIMIEQQWGRIISVTSTLAKEPSSGMVLSATTRAGVSAFTKSIAIDLAPYNITVNTILPGGVLTERLEGLFAASASKSGKTLGQELEAAQKSIPIARFAQPSEIAAVVAFLASELGSYITGQNIPVDGGLTKGVF